METKKFDVSEPRWRYWVNKATRGMRCPRCAFEVEPEQHAYVVLIESDDEIASYICGFKGGYFCSVCPTVVLDRKKFDRFVDQLMEAGECVYMVPGIVDMAAVPKNKRHLELGADDNPIPLVEFMEPKRKGPARARPPTRKKSKRKNRK